MSTTIVGQTRPIRQSGWFLAARGSNAGSPATAIEAARSVNGMDSVDLAGMGFYRKAWQLLQEQDPAPIPEAVARAIR
ncbi:hypothetical protein, partial [Candidatus Magnetaquicoccus inordinatus]|uniref:hypothetical protein n=1 Tax=Candidatus Magnetaquicoccus inordinatus TaxID=2496818 RepID=UPI00187D30F4